MQAAAMCYCDVLHNVSGGIDFHGLLDHGQRWICHPVHVH